MQRDRGFDLLRRLEPGQARAFVAVTEQRQRRRLPQAERAMLATLAEQMGDQPRNAALIWYAEADDFDGPAVMWRPACAVAARLAARFEGVELVTFDAQAYQQWRQARELPDNSASRSAWAAEQLTHDDDSSTDTR